MQTDFIFSTGVFSIHSILLVAMIDIRTNLLYTMYFFGFGITNTYAFFQALIACFNMKKRYFVSGLFE